MTHEPGPRVLVLLGRVLHAVYVQFLKCLLSARQRGRPPRRAVALGESL
jgi:hypothetical protein